MSISAKLIEQKRQREKIAEANRRKSEVNRRYLDNEPRPRTGAEERQSLANRRHLLNEDLSPGEMARLHGYDTTPKRHNLKERDSRGRLTASRVRRLLAVTSLPESSKSALAERTYSSVDAVMDAVQAERSRIGGKSVSARESDGLETVTLQEVTPARATANRHNPERRRKRGIVTELDRFRKAWK